MTTPPPPVELDVERVPWDRSGPPLGRHKVHDPRSRAHPIDAPRRALTLEPQLWRPTGRPLDQGGPLTFRRRRYGALGACTGMAAAKALSCAYLGADGRRRRGRELTESTALRLYSRATELDPWAGSWPDDDTGSSGLAVAKAATERGLVVRYEHAFSLEQALVALQLGPLIVGTWWWSGMDEPTAEGYVTPTGQRRGGHEYVVNGWDGRDVWCLQSWGSWGLGGRGVFRMSAEALGYLLGDDGDATRLVPPAA